MNMNIPNFAFFAIVENIRLELAWIDYLILAIYFVFVLGVGWVLRRQVGGARDYLESGRSLLLPHLIDADFDIINPVQCSAKDMDPARLKREFGDRLVFWGGGVDTQKTLPFGTPAEVRAEVLERLRIFAPDGGFVFNTIHNAQALTPTGNIVAMIDAIREYNTAGA
jgi:uroporphyrinogen-III decarboxylase